MNLPNLKIMKSKAINPIEIEPETIAEITETESEEIQGGVGSCNMHTCGTKTKEV
jgi:hypothetical protein